MTWIDSIVGADLLQVIGWTVVHFIWQGAAIGVLTAIALGACRRESPEVRYVIGAIGLGLMALAPIITAPFVAATVIQDAPPLSLLFIEAPPESIWTRLESILPSVAWVWLIGTIVLQVRLCLHWWRAQQYRQSQVTPVGTGWQRLADDLAAAMGVRRAVSVMESAVASTPMLVGWARPMILVPASALTGLSREQLRAVLAHELAHVRRHDYLINLIQSFVESVLFFHPIVWWLSGRMRTEREYCCDDAAVRICGDALVYAQALANLESLRSAPGSVEPAMASTGGSLMNRICRIVGVRNPMPRRLGGWVAPATVTLATTAVVSAVGIAPAPIEKATENPPIAEEVIDLAIQLAEETPPEDMLGRFAIEELPVDELVRFHGEDLPLADLGLFLAEEVPLAELGLFTADDLPLDLATVERLATLMPDALLTDVDALATLLPEAFAMHDGTRVTLLPEIVALDPATLPCPPEEAEEAEAALLRDLYRQRTEEAADVHRQLIEESVRHLHEQVDEEHLKKLHKHLMNMYHEHVQQLRLDHEAHGAKLHEHLKALLHKHQDDVAAATDHTRALHNHIQKLMHQYQDEHGKAAEHLHRVHDRLLDVLHQQRQVDPKQIEALMHHLHRVDGSLDRTDALLPRAERFVAEAHENVDRLKASLMEAEDTNVELERRLAMAEQRLAQTQAMIEQLQADGAVRADHDLRRQAMGLQQLRALEERRMAMERADLAAVEAANEARMAERLQELQIAAQRAMDVGDLERTRQLAAKAEVVRERELAEVMKQRELAERSRRFAEVERVTEDRRRVRQAEIRERLAAMATELSEEEIKIILERIEPILREIRERRSADR